MDYSKLIGRIIEKFGTREAFALAIGKSLSSVSGFLKGRHQLDAKGIAIWADALDIPYDEIGIYFFRKKVC